MENKNCQILFKLYSEYNHNQNIIVILDNAIKGAVESQEKRLEVAVLSFKGLDTITVKNSIDNSVLSDNPDLLSTKAEAGHGFGVKQIKEITEKYKGDIDIYEKNNMFIVSIVLG